MNPLSNSFNQLVKFTNEWCNPVETAEQILKNAASSWQTNDEQANVELLLSLAANKQITDDQFHNFLYENQISPESNFGIILSELSLRPGYLRTRSFLDDSAAKFKARKIVDEFPRELWCQIFSILPIKSIAQMAKTAKRFENLPSESELWQKAAESLYPKLSKSKLNETQFKENFKKRINEWILTKKEENLFDILEIMKEEWFPAERDKLHKIQCINQENKSLELCRTFNIKNAFHDMKSAYFKKGKKSDEFRAAKKHFHDCASIFHNRLIFLNNQERMNLWKRQKTMIKDGSKIMTQQEMRDTFRNFNFRKSRPDRHLHSDTCNIL